MKTLSLSHDAVKSKQINLQTLLLLKSLVVNKLQTRNTRVIPLLYLVYPSGPQIYRVHKIYFDLDESQIPKQAGVSIERRNTEWKGKEVLIF